MDDKKHKIKDSIDKLNGSKKDFKEEIAKIKSNLDKAIVRLDNEIKETKKFIGRMTIAIDKISEKIKGSK